LIVDVPHSADGMRSEPAVSVPVARGTCREASAAPEPPLEPPAERSSAQGCRPGRSSRRRRTRGCAGGRGAPSPRP
jgi:hypothetical protein